MQYFNKEYTKFFKSLEKNNNKEWFHANKKTYDNEVRKPMIAFVEDLITAMQKHDPEMKPIASKCLGRINRDIRFSKDKTPYNQHLFAHITKGTKEEPIPGIAFRFGGRDSGIMTGYYSPSKSKLAHIRTKIQNETKTFQKLKSAKKFVAKFGEVQGEAYKRVPKDLLDTFEKEPLIANKQFYYVHQRKPDLVTSKTLLKEIMDYWLAAKPLNDFFA